MDFVESFTLRDLIGYCIIIASFVVKIPQLTRIMRTHSVAGLSRLSAYAELIAYFNMMAFARHLGVGLSVYGETALISAQNFAVILAIYHYDTRIIIQEKSFFLGVFLLYAVVLLADQKVTEQAWNLISSSVIVLIAMARGSQVLTNH